MIEEWEYFVERDAHFTRLEELGKLGWQLCAIDSQKYGSVFYFKRQIN